VTPLSGGCVGGGEGTILRSGSYLYMLIEAPDITLGCLTTPGQQNWPLGLLRSPTFALPTGQWEQFAVEPTVIPIIKEGCYIQVRMQGCVTSCTPMHRCLLSTVCSTTVCSLMPPREVFTWSIGLTTGCNYFSWCQAQGSCRLWPALRRRKPPLVCLPLTFVIHSVKLLVVLPLRLYETSRHWICGSA
jgi:hypothetical protein